MIMLDTNVVVAFLKGDKSILKRIRDGIDRIALSSLLNVQRFLERSRVNLEV